MSTLVVVVVAMSGIAAAAAPTAGAGDAAIGNDSGMDDDSWFGHADNATFDSASAEVTEESDGEAAEVTFTYTAPQGKLVRLQAGDQSELRWATGEERDIGVDLRRWFFPAPEEYPIDVSAKILGGEECTATITDSDGAVTLCEGEPTEPETGTLEGVLENESYDRIAGRILVDGEDLQVDTDEDGDYSVDIEPGEYTITATADGYENEYRSVEVRADETTRASFALAPSGDDSTEPEQGTIEGTIWENATIADIPGATISIGEDEFMADENGEYSVSVDPGNYTVRANASSYVAASVNVSVTAGETTNANIHLERDDQEPPLPQGTLEGTVTDNETGGPIPGADVRTGRDRVDLADRNGTYSGSLDAGNHTVTVNVSGYEPVTRTVTVTSNETTTVDFALDMTEKPHPRGISGAVEDNETGRGIGGATVSAGGKQTTTSTHGGFGFDLRPGTYELRVNASGYPPYNKTVTVWADQPAIDQGVFLDPIEDTPANGTLEGTVTDNETGEPIAGATVSNGDAEFTTDENGTFSATAAAGEYTVTARAEDYETASRNVTLTANETTTADFALSPVAGGNGSAPDVRFEGTVIDNETGEPIAGATVSTLDETLTTDENGTYSYPATVETGEYEVTASANGYESGTRTVTVSSTGTTDPIRLDPIDEGPTESANATLEGTVTNYVTGNPIRNATVSLGDGDAEATTDADGRYSLRAAPGNYTLTVSAYYGPSDYYHSNSTDVTLTANETTTDVPLDPVAAGGGGSWPDVRFEGTVTDNETGEPIAGANVSMLDEELTTEEDGTYTTPGTIWSGEYEVTVSADGYETVTQNVTVWKNGTADPVALDSVE